MGREGVRCDPATVGDGDELCALVPCAVPRAMPFFELSSCWHLFVKASLGRQHFKLRLTAPRQITLQGRILKAEIVHFRLHVSGTAAPRTRAPGAGPSHWPKKLR